MEKLDLETETLQDPWVVYVVVNSSLDMNVGKIAAAVGHAVHYLLREYYTEVSKLIPTKDRSHLRAFAEWDENFHRKIVLKASASELSKLLELTLVKFPVVDAGFSQVETGSLTAVAFWPLKKSEAPKLLKRLRLLTTIDS
jgi:peptidyl-tRNA hydrolase